MLKFGKNSLIVLSFLTLFGFSLNSSWVYSANFNEKLPKEVSKTADTALGEQQNTEINKKFLHQDKQDRKIYSNKIENNDKNSTQQTPKNQAKNQGENENSVSELDKNKKYDSSKNAKSESHIKTKNVEPLPKQKKEEKNISSDPKENKNNYKKNSIYGEEKKIEENTVLNENSNTGGDITVGGSVNKAENSSEGFDFIKSNKEVSGWLKDGKILLYSGITLILVSIFGLFMTFKPKKKSKRKRKILR